MEQVVFVQISDTHFGPNLLNKRFGWIEGYREHDVTLLTAFQAALRDVKRVAKMGDQRPFILHNGDVTATGESGEFAAAELYFRGERPLNYGHRNGSYIGLKLLPTELSMLPGNHDHWDGRRFRYGPYNQKIFGQYFQTTPWCQVLKSVHRNHEKQVIVELYGVDSNSGLRDVARWHSAFAKGRISDQEFARLTEKLEEMKSVVYDNALVVRAFVVHHPMALKSRNPFLKALNPEAVEKLLTLAQNYNIFAVLDGHTHRFHYHSYDTPSNGRQLHEFRSATTFQGPASEGTQGFIAHQIVPQDDGRLVWKAWQYKFACNGFACALIQPGDQPWWQRTV